MSSNVWLLKSSIDADFLSSYDPVPELFKQFRWAQCQVCPMARLVARWFDNSGRQMGRCLFVCVHCEDDGWVEFWQYTSSGVRKTRLVYSGQFDSDSEDTDDELPTF